MTTTRLPIIPRSAGAVSLPTVQALDALWGRVQQKPLWAPPNFWRYLKLRSQVRLRFLNVSEVDVKIPPGKINACSECFDICCVSPHSTVLLRLRDIATLMDVGRTDLIAHHKPQFSDEVLVQRPALKFHISSRAWDIFPVLKQNSFSACAALNTEGQCTLYPHWPLSCARFPYSLDVENRVIFFSKRCDSFFVKSENTEAARAMVVAAVASYNERIKDWILLAYAAGELRDMGLLKHLKWMN